MPRHKTAHRQRLEQHHKDIAAERPLVVKELKKSGTLKPYAGREEKTAAEKASKAK